MTTAAALRLEVKETPDTTGLFVTDDNVVVGQTTPEINEDYWIFRVKVSETQAVLGFTKFGQVGIGFAQAVLGFTKFGQVGIGFAQEVDWNTNLPSRCTAEEIWQHIRKNAAGADEAVCLQAIEMIRQAAQRL